MQIALKVLLLLTLASAVNIPLGYWRQGCEKFSPTWFFFVHISIPFIIIMRMKLGLAWPFIPFSLAGAVSGQLAGGRVYRKRNCLG
ncbi:hypothetical protein LPW11_11060 [Geomonas sp. RF6]|uniref:hypothetical protein n=1 Tax=Geomonas sp. RF6 TaxID=2897342 RepID=UPI001E43AF75|nr:hypothetical protein [Geomonas sp. RF6]UFS72713.1 hypothetical protein LPW11_11060 [Geomonas sp. RF6]